MATLPQSFPLATQPIADPTGRVTQSWRQFLLTLWNRTGGSGDLSSLLVGASGITIASVGTQVQISGGLPSITDVRYGGAADGVTDDTAAWNLAVADFNSGDIDRILVPGRSLVSGALDAVNMVEGKFTLVGFGPRVSAIEQTSAADVTMLSVTTTGFGGKVLMQDVALLNAQRAGQALYIHVDPASMVALSNVEVSGQPDRRAGGFTRGIELVNVTSSTFMNVTVHGWKSASGAVPYPDRWQNTDWGWYVHAEGGSSSTNNRWISCDILFAKIGWKCDLGNLQGFFWTNCTPAWCGVGWEVEATGAGAGPCFGWQGGSPECFHKGIVCTNVAYIAISDLTFLMDMEYAEVRRCVELNNCTEATAHANMLVNIGALSGINLGTCDFLVATDCTKVKSRGNQLNDLDAYGVRWTGTSQYCDSVGDRIYFPSAAAIPYKNDSSSPLTNSRLDMKIDGGTAAQGTSPQVGQNVTVGVLGVVQTPYVQVLMGVEPGDKIRVSTAGFLEYTVGEASPQMVVREYNHRPGSAVPYTILERANGRTNFINWFHLTADKGQEYLDREFTFDIVAGADDALFSLELSSAGALGNTCTFDRASMTVDRL